MTEADTLATALSPGSLVGAPTATDWLRILHIEDNPADARLAQEYLRASLSAVEFDSASRLSELSTERATSADCALLDLSLPDAVGLEALVALRALAGDLPIIVLTGFDELEFGLAALRNGADDFLIKNHLDGFMLSRAVRYAIERRELMAAAVTAAVDAGFASSVTEPDFSVEPSPVVLGVPARTELEVVTYATIAKEELLTPSAVAALLYVDPKTVTRWAKAGKIASFRTPGGHRRFVKSEILALLAAESTHRRSRRPASDLTDDAATAEIAEAIANASQAQAKEVAIAVVQMNNAVLENAETAASAADAARALHKAFAASGPST